MTEFIFNATGSDDGFALQTVLSSMTPSDRLTIDGVAQILPYTGMPTYIGVNGAIMNAMLRLTNGVIRCAPGGSIYGPDVPDGYDLLCWQPLGGVESPEIDRLNVVATGGRDAFVICTANNSQIQNPKIDHGKFIGTGSGHAFHILNDAVANPNGGFFDAMIEGTVWSGGGRFDHIGDGVEFHEVNASGPKCSIDVSFVGGAASCRVVNNSLTGAGGGLLMRNGINAVITGNSFEPCDDYDYFSYGGNGYSCDLRNIVSARIADNVFSMVHPDLGQTAYIYVLSAYQSIGIEIEQNTFFARAGVMHPYSAAILLYNVAARVNVHQQVVQGTFPGLLYDPSGLAVLITPLAQWPRV